MIKRSCYFLQSSIYTLDVEAKGFKKFDRQHIELLVDLEVDIVRKMAQLQAQARVRYAYRKIISPTLQMN